MKNSTLPIICSKRPYDCQYYKDNGTCGDNTISCTWGVLRNKMIVSTFNFLEVKNKRQCGNSTRQIDKAIQLLFNGYIVLVRDHVDNGENTKANRRLFERIIKRIDREHAQAVGLKNFIKMDSIDLTIELK